MKKLVIGAAVAGSAAFAFRRFAAKARKMRDHCRDMIAGHQEARPTASTRCGS